MSIFKHVRELAAIQSCAPLRGWLRQSVHGHGASQDPADLVHQATGSRPSTRDYLAHLQSRTL